MIVETPELSIAEVVRKYRETYGLTYGKIVYGVWRPSECQRKTFSVHMMEPTDSLRPTELMLEISDGRVFPIDQPTRFEERDGEHGLAWTQIMGRPTFRTKDGPRSTLEFEPEAADVPTPRPGKWWQK
jgi:hypothetical protein